MNEHETLPLRVHIVQDDTRPAPGPAVKPKPRRVRRSLSPRTFVLTTSNPVLEITAPEPNRCSLSLLAIDNPVVVCTSLSQAEDAANTTANLPNPNGLLLPVSTVPFPLDTTDRLWVTAAAYPARVSVANISYEDND